MRTLILLLNPFAPHITEEMWQKMGYGKIIEGEQFPRYNEAKCTDQTVEIVVQICGKIKARIKTATEATKEEVMALAMNDENVKNALDGKQIVKEIFVSGKLLNIVAK